MGYTIESIRAWRNLPFEGLNSPIYVFSIPQDSVKEGSSFPIAEKWEPTGPACEIWRFLQEGETDMSSLVGCYLSHGLPSTLGSPEGNRLHSACGVCLLGGTEVEQRRGCGGPKGWGLQARLLAPSSRGRSLCTGVLWLRCQLVNWKVWL